MTLFEFAKEQEQEMEQKKAQEINASVPKLTTRQWGLYNLLKSDPSHWFTQKEICEAVEGYEYNDDELCHDHCPSIRQDKVVINASPRVDGIIVLKNNCFKMATYEEYKQERASHIARLKSQVKQIQDMDFKMKQDGQYKLFNNIMEVLNDSNEQYHDTFKGR